MMPQGTARTIVGEPLTPDLLAGTGGLGTIPETPAAFHPEGEWVNEYRIHVCHGYIESGNHDVGVLRIERTPTDVGSGATLKVRRRIVHDEGQTHVAEAWIRCSTDSVSSLEQWRLRSVFLDIAGAEIEALGCEESGEVSGGRIVVTRDGKAKSWESNRPVAADWTLVDAVQRLLPGVPAPPEFDMLEELGGRREKQSLLVAEPVAGGRAMKRDVRVYRQTGHGVLPLEYWLDSRNRLLIATTGPRAYVLDSGADARADERLGAIRRRKAARS